MFENITSSEVAGYCVGAMLLAATLSAPKIDFFIAANQRSSAGMCKRCGDLRLIACSNCKGTGSISGGLSFNLKGSPSSCTKCRARGHFSCPACSQT